MGMFVKSLKTVKEHLLMEDLQAEIWCREEVVPMNQTLTAVKNGGIALGLFDDEVMVGFCYGFAGFKNGKAYLCSHMLGLKEGYRHGGWGEKLKLAQREEALDIGYDLMTWTYDPLESPNAKLNIAKLRGIVRTYIPNCYGEMRSSLNLGLPSDRFLLEWHLNSERVVAPAPAYSALDNESIGKIDLEGEEPYLAQTDLNFKGKACLFPVPLNFQSLRQTNPKLALDWRLKARLVIEAYFGKGFVVTDFVSGNEVNYYLLEKEV